MGDSTKKIAVAGLAAILLVVAVLADGDSSSSSAVETICSLTDYKETCEKSLANTNTSDPRELIEVAFKAAIDHIAGAVKDSDLIKEATKDQSTRDAFNVCEEVLETAVDDLKRSADKISELDASKISDFVEDLKTWLSAVITNQETCIDAFENTTGDTGEKMRTLLKTAKEMSSNGLAMVSDISSLISLMFLSGASSSRKLLSEEEEGRMLWNQDSSDSEPGAELKPNAVVAQDGSGQFKTIKEAIATVPKKNNVPFLIHVKAGVYREHIEIPKGANKVVMFGDGPLKTIITDKKNFADGTKTFQTATFAVNADDFFARDMLFDNTAGPEGHQAVALRVSGDRAVFYNVHIYGFQDTLYTHTYRQFYRDCVISGTIDFIFGDALAIFQNCVFVVRRPMDNQACMVTAQGRIDPRSQGAIVIQNGNIVAEPQFFQAPKPIMAYLGRPWKELSRTIIMQSNIDGFISPDGWSPWMGNFALNTLFYAEYQNRGPGSNEAHRVKWKGIKHISAEVAESWTPGKAFGGDFWIKGTGIPYVPTMM
ncbi:probable pectinesterase/pectinesterase inhibitor 58 [Phtheirospermum japonicum]|uniref:Pectinesterase n=1 Tax=Phtheirospermum japonicum TaxID=374723 RepID=A0A830D6G0_9LAMI|nr:probable pectinesterase/pectinesterase inhibitor 58 [Phtheirospermum japonicum]